MRIQIDGIATVWLQKRNLPTKGTSTPEVYKAKVEAYLIANPKDWPYYNRKGRMNPFSGAELTTTPAVELAPATLEDLAPPPPAPPTTTSGGNKKIYYVVVRKPQRLVREFLKTYAHGGQREEEKWSDNPAWADRFLVPEGAAIVAKRVLGHNNFKVEPL